MVSRELLQPPIGSMPRTTAAVALDADFDFRWATWVARGQVHEKRVRRRFIIWACTLALGGAGVYAFFK
jgi:hypothetical protein